MQAILNFRLQVSVIINIFWKFFVFVDNGLKGLCFFFFGVSLKILNTHSILSVNLVF